MQFNYKHQIVHVPISGLLVWTCYIYRHVAMLCQCFRCYFLAGLDRNTRKPKVCSPSERSTDSNHPSALIRDIHLSVGGEFFSIFNLIVLSAYMTSILEF